MSEPHALVASYAIPEPDRNSGDRRILDLIDFLREAGYRVTFVAAGPIVHSNAAHSLESRKIAVYEGMVTRREEIGPEVILHEIITAQPVDLALLAFWPVAELCLPIVRRICPNARVIVDSVDLHCLRHARRSFISGAKLLDADFAAQMTGELNVYAAADGVLTVSETEAAWIDNFCATTARTFFVPDCEELSPVARSFSERRGILMLGSYRYPPNVDGLNYLCKEILPRVDRSLLQGHPLEVVGDGVDELVRETTRGTPYARLIGWVPSLTPHLEQARISVVPLRYGAGTKRKVIQSLLSGTPTVTTAIGAEGLDIVHEQHALIADTPQDFASAIVRLLTDERLWRRLSEQGALLMRATHSRAVAKQRFLLALQQIQETPPRSAILTETTAKGFLSRIRYDYLYQLLAKMQFHLLSQVPADATVIVLSGGDERLLNLDGLRAWHFPQIENGQPVADATADAKAMVQSLERLRQQGGRYFLVPFPEYWWLEHFPEFDSYLNKECRLIASQHEVGKLFELKASACTGWEIPATSSVATTAATLRSVRSKPRTNDWRRLFPFIVPLLSLLLGLLFSEIMLRISQPYPLLRTEWVLQHPLARVANRDMILIPPRFLDESFYRTDPTRRTVIALGDSFTEGFRVRDLDTFPAMLERMLYKQELDAQVINAGIGDSGPDQHLRLLRQYLLPRLQPAILIWALYANDIEDNYTKPVYKLSGGQLAPLDSRLHWIYIRQIVDQWMPFPRWLKDHSYVYRTFMKAFESFGTVALPDPYKNNPTAWSVEKLRLEIQTVKELAATRNFPVYFVLIAPQSVYLAKNEPERWAQHNHNKSYAALLAILKDEPNFIHAWFPSANPAEIFADKNRDANAYGTRHYNEAGNRLLAELVMNRMVNDKK